MLPSKLRASGGVPSLLSRARLGQSGLRPPQRWPAAASPKTPVAGRELGSAQRRSGLAPRHARCRLGNVGSSEERGCLVSSLSPPPPPRKPEVRPSPTRVAGRLPPHHWHFLGDVHVFPYALRQWQAPEARHHSADSLAPLKAWCTTSHDGTRSLSAATPSSDAPRGVLSWSPTFWDSC